VCERETKGESARESERVKERKQEKERERAHEKERETAREKVRVLCINQFSHILSQPLKRRLLCARVIIM